MTDRTIVHDVQIITLNVVLSRHTTTISAIFPLHNRARVVFVYYCRSIFCKHEVIPITVCYFKITCGDFFHNVIVNTEHIHVLL